MKQTLEQKIVMTQPRRWDLSLPFSERRALLWVGDVVSVILALLVGNWAQSILGDVLSQEPNLVHAQLRWLILLAVVWLAFAVVNEVYDLQVAHRHVAILQAIILNLFETGIFYLLLFFAISRPAYVVIPLFGELWQIGYLDTPPRLSVLIFLAAVVVCTILWRLAYIKLFTSFPFQRRIIVVGAGRAGRNLARALREETTAYELVGFIDDAPHMQDIVTEGVPILGGAAELLQQVQQTGTSEVILAITDELQDDLFRAMATCYEHGIPIRPMSVLYEEIFRRVPVEHLGQKWIAPSFWSSPATSGFYQISKRGLDIVLGSIGFLVLLVLLPVLALVIYIDLPGPIFYTQERLGRGGRPFRVIKLRSMIPDAERGGARWATRNDARITRVGRFLRRTRLDELPQVLNVLRGEMSIIGPRPERPEFITQLQEQIPFYRARLNVKPGLTGWAQIRYRYGNTVDDALVKLQYDLYYIKNRSLLLDILIVLRTVKVMLMFKGT